jgi:amino acid transporter
LPAAAHAASADATTTEAALMTVVQLEQRSLLRRELSRFDTVFFLISAMVVVDTIGAIAVGGGQAFTWLVVVFVTFFIPSALVCAEMGAALPHEGGAYVWVRRALGRFPAALTSLLYWAGTPLWLGGSVAVVGMAVFQRFVTPLQLPGLFVFGGVFVGLATLGAVVPLRYGKWVPTSGAIGQIVLLAFFTVTVIIYGFQHGVHGIGAAGLTPSGAVFVAVVPVLLYSFTGVELPTTAAEEMRNPRRDIPAAIARAGVGQALMYGIPILAILVVLPADQITSLHGLIDALAAVLTVYGGQWLGWACAAVFLWVLLASGSTWIIGAGRAQAAACLDGAGPAFLGRISPRTGVPVRMGLVTGAISLATLAASLWLAREDGQKYFSAALTVAIALIVLAYLMIYPAFLVIRYRFPRLERPFRVPGGRAVAWLVTVLATSWTLLATICLLWPGFGMADPDAALPSGFEGQRGQFELVVLVPVLGAVLSCAAYFAQQAIRERHGRRR